MELNQRDAKNDDEQHPRNRRGVALLEVLETAAIQIKNQGDRGVVRSLGWIHQDEDLLKDLHGLNGGGGHNIESRGRKHGKGNVPELVPCACAVHSGGFVQFTGDVLQTSEEEYGVKSHGLPGGDDDDGE